MNALLCFAMTVLAVTQKSDPGLSTLEVTFVSALVTAIGTVAFDFGENVGQR